MLHKLQLVKDKKTEERNGNVSGVAWKFGRRPLHRRRQLKFPSSPALQCDGCRTAEQVGCHHIPRVLFGTPQLVKPTTIAAV